MNRKGLGNKMIYTATVKDADALLELNSLFGNETTIELLRQSIIENDCEIVGVAYIDNTAVGYCTGLITKSMCYSKCRLDIEALYVKENHRNRGIGKELLAFVEQCGISRGIHHFHINAYPNNGAAFDIYSKQGYIASGEVLLEKDA